MKLLQFFQLVEVDDVLPGLAAVEQGVVQTVAAVQAVLDQCEVGHDTASGADMGHVLRARGDVGGPGVGAGEAPSDGCRL